MDSIFKVQDSPKHLSGVVYMSALNFDTILKENKKIILEKFNILYAETIRNCKFAQDISKKYKKNTIIIIIDLDGVKMMNVNVKIMKKFIKNIQRDLKDILETLYFINVSKSIKLVYNLIASFIDKDTKKKIVFNYV